MATTKKTTSRTARANDVDWNQVRALVVESYRMIAPKALAARVQG